ncbi:dynein heavy chain domain-containing protein 1-like isoform X6 [Lytechinus variegatus]|uniref:dynein heavy chain domain-containing protein 1-like isoform X6 n=1 Tax=Lytechinus variegatus TaxID=7654 RepID=UPI001BB2B825|nr:dynein heavy chain domain-containing protein 1-like isoform X6 [Lytechinus variegatus]
MSSLKQPLSPRVIPLLKDSQQTPAKTPHAHISKYADPKLLSSTWALDVRKDINLHEERGERPDNSLINDLITELSAVFISALQRNSRHQWLYLAEVLRICLPYSHYLQDDDQLRHYVNRTYYQTRQYTTPTAGSDLDDLLANLFPKAVLALKSTGGDAKDYRNPLTPARTPNGSSPRYNPLSMSLPDGADPYTLERPGDEEKHTPRGINLGHIREVLPSVVMETTRHEAVWSEGLGMTAAAMNIDLNDKKPSPRIPAPPPRLPDSSWKSEGLPLRQEDLAVSEDAESELSEDIPLTGKEVVEMFGKGRHLGNAKFIYLNRTPTRHFMPYELTVVPKHKANPEEHWIVSCFGIMHKVRGQPAESMNLYDWHREAVLWGILTKIPFFKYNLLRKTFNRWRSGQKHQEFCNIRKKVHDTLLLAVPGFGAASIQVSKLLQELGTVRFLPLELDHCFTLPEFEHRTKMMYKTGQVILNKFFHFCKLILDKACEDSYAMLDFCKQQANKDKALFSKESLFVQRQKKEQREANLLKAQNETKRLGNFILLVDQMLVCHLLALTRYNVCTFVRHTMVGTIDAPREALYKAKLNFTSKGALTLHPSKQMFLDSLDATIIKLANIISDAARPIEEVTAGWVGNQRERLFQKDEDADEGRSDSEMSVREAASSQRFISTAAERLQEPVLIEQKTPRKEFDHLGVATPELCKKNDLQEDYVVVGERMVGQYNPLTEGSLADRLLSDEEISSARELQTEIITAALEEIDTFCEHQSWLADIHRFARKWNKDTVLQWKRAQAYSIETKLGEIRDWCEQVKNVDRSFVTQNGLFHIDCGAIQEDLVPLLNNAFRDLLNFTASEAKNLSMEFMTEIKGVVMDMQHCGQYKLAVKRKGMKEKSTDVKDFADYAKQYNRYKIKMPELQKEVEYVKSLFEVIRLSYRSLTPEEEKCEEGVWQNWEAFLLQLQDAAEFVNMQTPIQIGNLDEEYQLLYSEAKKISSEASKGIFLDPSQKPMMILDKLSQLFNKFTRVNSRINECSEHKMKITGQKYDVSELTEMFQAMTVRHQLWKFVEVSTGGIVDWKQMLFRKMNVSKAMSKVTDWQQAAGQLKQVLPQGDLVLAHWYQLLSDFKQDLPLLLKLSSDCLKSRHWKSLFLALGQVYEPGRQYYVRELLSYNLSEHSLQISTICAGATAEFDLEQKLVKLRKVWEEKEFKLAKYLAPGKETFDFELPSSDKKDGKKAKSDMYTLIGHEELKYLLEDNQLTLQSMLVSPHLADLRPEADSWALTLRQVEDMLELWTVCQKKWLYLSQVFSDEIVGENQPYLANQFEGVDEKYQEFITAVVDDPKVLSILNRRKGTKGFRELQGDNLTILLNSLIKIQDDILANLDPFSATKYSIETARRKYPRLCFLSNHELIDLFSNFKDRQRWIPQVRALFPGVRHLDFEAPTSSEDGMSALDLLLNSDKLEVTALRGSLDERLSLITPLPSKPSPPAWLSSLEIAIKTTMGNTLHSCLESRLREGMVTGDILSELSSLDRNPSADPDVEAQLKKAVRQSFCQWLLRFPSQCVLTGEGVLWSRDVLPAVRKGDLKQLTQIRDNLQRRLDQYSLILRENNQSPVTSEASARLQILVGSLIEQGMHHRDIVEDLLAKKELSDRDFDWRKVLHYDMDFKTVLCAQSVVDPDQETGRKSEAAKSVMTTTDDFSTITDKPQTREAAGPRTKTVVGTGFAFGPLRVCQLGATFPYDHEYLGPGPRLVATPLTDRCHMSLTNAMRQRQCGAVIGPSGVGKTETVKELANFMGQNVVTLDCAVDSSIVTVSRFLSGAVQSGSWLLLDNADRLTHGLMAVVSQQLEYLCHAYHILQDTNCLYSKRGASKHDYKNPEPTSPKRRHSLATLHSSQVRDDSHTQRPTTFPASTNEKHGPSKFDDVFGDYEEECEVGQFGKRRHSISRSQYTPEDHYDSDVPTVPLFVEMQGPVMYRAMIRRPASRDSLTDSPEFSPLQQWTYRPENCGYVSFDSRMVLANVNYNCFMTINTGDALGHPIPESLKNTMRPVAMVKPDLSIILETVLIYNGFQEAPMLAAKLCQLSKMVQHTFPEEPIYQLSVGNLKGIIHLATSRLFSKRRRYQLSARSSGNDMSRISSEEVIEPVPGDDQDFITGLEEDDLHREECSLVFALQLFLTPRNRSVEHSTMLRNMLRSLFPWGMGSLGRGVGAEHDPVLVDAIQSQFVADCLQATPLHVSKVLELYESLRYKSGVVLVGSAGSGKTVCYQTLCRVLNSLQANPPTPDEGPTAPMHGPKVQGLEGVPRHQLSQPMERLRRKAEVVSFMTLHWMDTASRGAEKPSYPRVDSSVIYPATLSMKQLIGEFNVDRHRWRDGLVTSLIYGSGQSMQTAEEMQRELQENKKKNATKGMLNPPTVIQKWVVMDGVIDPRWAETLAGLIGTGRGMVGGRGSTTLPSGERLPMPNCTSLIFETSTVTNASPATMARCAVIHFGTTVVSWKSLVESWISGAQSCWEVSNNSLQLLQNLMDDTFARTLDFLSNTHCIPALESDLPRTAESCQATGVGIREVGSFLRILTALCDHHLVRESGDGNASPATSDNKLDERKTPRPTPTPTPSLSVSSMTRHTANKTTLLTSMFAFAYVWGFGGHLHDRHTEMFDQFARQLLGRATHDIILPPEGTVYDIHIDATLGILVSWADTNREKMRTISANFVVTPEAERYFHLLDILVGANQPVLLTGAPGIGKTALIQNMVQQRHHFLSMAMSPVLGCETMEKMIVGKLRPRSVVNVSSQPTKPGQIPTDPLFFIDDLNCAGMDKTTGEQPCLELLRQLMAEGSIYQRDSLSHYSLEKTNFITACYPPGTQGVGSGTSCHSLSSRLSRLFVVLSYFTPSAESLNLLHAGSLQSWLEEFPAYSLNHHYELAQAIVKATIRLHSLIKRQLMTSPVNPHYVFSLHDVNRIVQGMFLMANRSGRSKGRHGRRGGGQRSQAKGTNRSRRGRTEKLQKEGPPPMMRTIIRLWCHEACRTYYDRIVSTDDQFWFRNTLEDVIQTFFCGGPPKKHRPSPPPMPIPISTPDKVCEGTEASEDQDSSSQQATPPLPASPTPTMNTVTDDAEETQEGAIADGDGDQGAVSSLDVPLDLKLEPTSTPAPVPAIVKDLAPDSETSQSPKTFQPCPPPPRIKTLHPTPPSQPAVPPAIKKEGEESKTRVGLKRGVTFKPGLIHTDANEEEQDVFKGPLIEMSQLKDPEEDLCAILFAKFVPGIGKEGNYVEYTEPKIQAGLESCLAQYNATAQQKMELVFFTESIRHIARLTRVLGSENANALLIGMTNGTGRSSLTHLASYMARCKLYTPQLTRDPVENRRRLRNQMKRASKTAGLVGRPAVLLVKEEVGPEAMEDLCCMIKEGTCPDLFTGEELESFASQMLTGAKVVPGQRNQRLEMAQERLLRTIMKNLHVVVCMDCQDHNLTSLTDRLKRYPVLLTSHCVDSYLPWTQEGLARVAQHWLKVPTRDAYTDKRIRLPWPSHFQDRGVEALCQAMAYVHTTAAATTERLYVKPFKFFTPSNYLDFLDLFKNLTYKITKEERANVKKYEQALEKVNEAFSSISDYHGEITALNPEYQMAKQRTEQILEEVHECEQIFADARGNCTEDEKDILALQEPLNDMKKEAQAELDKVNPVYEAALHALRSLDKAALNELRTFHAPPAKVINVINAVCLMFRQPMDWSNGKVLINRKNFFQELEFYDKTSIPNDIFHKLNILFIQDPTFDPEVIKTASVAASSLCMWVHAVYAYAVIHRNMRPKLQSVEEAEAKVQEAQGHLGSKRVKAQDMKGLLEQKRKEYQESIRQVKLYEKKIQAIEAKIKAATDLMDNMEEQHQSWKESLDLSNNHLKTAPGDSLLAAACTTYMGPMDETTRALVLADWLHACRNGRYQVGAGRASAMSGMENSLAASPALNAVQEVNADTAQGILPDDESPSAEVDLPAQLSVIDEDNNDGSRGSTSRRDQPESEINPAVPIRQNFTVEDILSDKEELISWRHSSRVVCDQFSVDNALYVRACIIGRRRQWPLLIDPDNQALNWIVQLKETGLASFHETVYEEEEEEESLGQDGELEEELNNPELTEDRLMESRNLESAATSNFALSRADQSSLGGETDYGTEFPETPRTLTTNGGVTPKDNMSEKDFDIHSVGTSLLSANSHPISVDLDGARPFSDLWVVSADDVLLEERLIQSVVMGLSLVITNLERRDFDVRFSDVMGRNVVENEEGEKSVRIGSHMYSYNTRFALYLTTSVPLELEGAGFLKPHTDRFSVIDMSVNQEGLTTRLLMDVMDAERPDFANHHHSIKSDIRGHNKMLQETDLDILNKVIELKHGILDDAVWGDTLNAHHTTIQDTTSHLKESCNLLAQLLEKQHPYRSVAEHGALLFFTIKRIWQLLPTYYIPLRRFIRWFGKTIGAREKDRTDTASLKARAVELCNALTEEIHAHLSCGFFQHHSDLFVFLVAMERMRSSKEISQAEWDLLVTGLDGAVIKERDAVFDEVNDSCAIPEWLTNEIWIKCGHLEQLVPAFQGLRQSMLRHSSQWKEYFSCNPVLLAPVPGPDLQDLSFCQKALLWRVVLPDRLAVICRHLVVYELGAHTGHPEVYNAEEVLKSTSKNIPLIFVLPAGYHEGKQTGMEGHTVIDPLAEITLYCKQKDVRTVINTVSLGNEKQMSQAVDALQECIANGHWLILNNCQAVDQWSEEFLQIIQHIVTPASNVEKTLPAKPVEKTKRDDATTTDAMSQAAPSQSSIYEGMEVHSDFKLIFVMTADSKTPLPGLVVQNGMQVACQTNSNFKATLRTFFNQAMAAVDQHRHMVTTTQAKSLTELVFCMALLHTVLSHRRMFYQLGFNKDYSWGVADLKAMMSCLNWSYKGESPWESIKTLRTFISQLVYGGHADILDDAETVNALIDSLLQPWINLKKMPSSMGATSLLASLVNEMSRGRRSGSSAGNMVARRFQHLFNTMQDDVEPAHLGLPPSAQQLQEERSSRYLSEALQALERYRPDHHTWYHPSLPKFLLSLEEELTIIPPLPPPPAESLNHLQNFISSEVSLLSCLLERVHADVDLLLKAVVGEAALAPDINDILSALSSNVVPSRWALRKGGVLPNRMLLPDWLKHLRKRVETLQGYVDAGEAVSPYYRLDSFSHPEAFMDAVMLEHGRKEYLELHQLQMNIEVTGMERCPSKPPAQGVYLWGLTLHNAGWDPKRSVIQLPTTNTPSHQSSALPVIWLKPGPIADPAQTGSEKGSPLSTYLCPVHCGDVHPEELHRSEAVLKVDLSCTLDSNMWKLKRVYATSS